MIPSVIYHGFKDRIGWRHLRFQIRSNFEHIIHSNRRRRRQLGHDSLRQRMPSDPERVSTENEPASAMEVVDSSMEIVTGSMVESPDNRQIHIDITDPRYIQIPPGFLLPPDKKDVKIKEEFDGDVEIIDESI